MKKLLLSLTLLFFSQTILLAQIVSTTTGGNWSETSTWVGGVIPTTNDDVVFDGNIIVDQSIECKNLTVNSGKLVNGDGMTRTFKVNGNLVNNGNISVNNGRITFEIGGDLYLNGAFDTYSKKINGTTDQELRYISSNGYNVTITLISELTGSNYQWYKDGTIISGATNQTFGVILSAQNETADYKCVVDGSDSRTISLRWGEDSNISSILKGKVTNAVDGTPISGALVVVGQLTTTTDVDGNYEIADILAATLNAAFSGTPLSGSAPLEVSFTDQSNEAAHTVVVSATGFSTYTNNQVVINEGETLSIDVSLSPTLTTGEMRIVLNWGSAPNDLDSYLVTPDIDGNTYTVYYNAPGEAVSAPYVTLDHDDINAFGPETITIYQKHPGTYKYYVYNYSASPDITTSNGVVQVYTGAGLVSTVNIPNTGSGLYWNVLTIDGTTGNVTVTNTINDSPPNVAPTMPNKIINSIQLSKLADGTESISSWAWSFGDGASSTLQNPNHTYAVEGDYTVTLVASNGTDNSTETKTNYISVSEGSTSGGIVSTTAGGLWDQTSTWIGGVVPTATDDVIIDGTVVVYGHGECKNLTVNSGKMLTCSYNGSSIKISENVVNNGIIQDDITNSNTFYLEIKGNITNNGVWSNSRIMMDATTDQTISGTTPFTVRDFMMGQDAYASNGQKLVAGSDLSFDGTMFYFGESEFIIDSEKTVSFVNTNDDGSGSIIMNVHFNGGGTVNADSVFLFGDTWFRNVTLTGVIVEEGVIVIKENVELLGTLTTSRNYRWVHIEEDFTNDGIIKNSYNNSNLDITVYKNITNNGFWENYQITMDGTTDQTFTNNNSLHAQFKFISNVPSATTFQWYKDGVAMSDVYANGEVYYYYKPVNYEEYNPYGEYYCQTNAGNSRKMTIVKEISEAEEVLAENFDGSTFPPNGWTQTITNTSNTWKQGNPDENNFSSFDATNVFSALCPWVAEDQNELLKSPIVALPNDQISLEFYAGYGTDWLSSATMKLNISVDGGTNWTKLWEANNDGNGWQWRKVSLDLDSYKNNSNVMFGWQYVGNDGDLVGIDNVKIISGVVGIEENMNVIPTEFALNQNYPNPFNPSTIISYQLPKQGFVSINIYNILGQKITSLINKSKSAGNHQLNFDASNLSAGTYIYQLKVGDFVQSKKMLLLK